MDSCDSISTFPILCFCFFKNPVGRWVSVHVTASLSLIWHQTSHETPILIHSYSASDNWLLQQHSLNSRDHYIPHDVVKLIKKLFLRLNILILKKKLLQFISHIISTPCHKTPTTTSLVTRPPLHHHMSQDIHYIIT